MRKLLLAVLALFTGIVAAYAQCRNGAARFTQMVPALVVQATMVTARGIGILLE